MEQEQALRSYKEMGKVIGELLLKAMYLASTKVIDATAMRLSIMQASNQPIGEQDWDDFMKRPENKELKTFFNHEVNIEQMKQYLKDYGVDFAVQKGEDGRVKLLFASKDTAVVTQAFDDLVKNLTSEKGKELNKKLLKTPKNMSFEEKLAYKSRQTKETIKLHQAKQVKAPAKEVRNEVNKS